MRERLKEKVEVFFGCEYELLVEFTGLISYGKDFEGWLFNFQHGEPKSIAPLAGESADVVMYTSDGCNIHSVDEVTLGERLILTLWLSRDSSHVEDAKIISLLS